MRQLKLTLNQTWKNLENLEYPRRHYAESVVQPHLRYYESVKGRLSPSEMNLTKQNTEIYSHYAFEVNL